MAIGIMKTHVLIIRYAGFAVAAGIANLAAQRLVLSAGGADVGIWPAIFAGTAVGLILKYLLDKRWIFYDRSRGAAVHGRKFTLYTLMGIATTLIFWGSESTFWLLWKTDAMREMGAVLGLTVGYIVKYNLDRRFVFSRTTPALRR